MAKLRHSPFAGRTSPEDLVSLAQPDASGVVVTYAGSDADAVTAEGELNKIAMGRSMGGAHWRSNNTRSLRLGE